MKIIHQLAGEKGSLNTVCGIPLGSGTTVIERVTCPCCKGHHEWEETYDETYSSIWYCKGCGIERDEPYHEDEP